MTRAMICFCASTCSREQQRTLPEAAEMLKKMHWDFFTGQSYKSEAEIAAIY
ncbi:Hypothetical protein LBU_0868 [Lactobacillus delbrueckii subsp. bulgaricus 2038]|nr:Hypothetical protein LBU_0868 [Lactobacillus delbrueckii subsp. bulgaricus 2038]